MVVERSAHLAGETSVSNSTPTSEIIYDACTSIIKINKEIAEKTLDEDVQKLK